MCSCIQIKSQTVSLEHRSDGRFKGWTELTINKTDQNLLPRVLFLNARQMQIETVEVNGNQTNFDYINTRSSLENLYDKTPYLIRDFGHFVRVCMEINNTPELIIPIPEDYPLNVKINFTLNSDTTAIVERDNIIYTDPRVDGASALFPCIDGYSQLSRFSLTVTCSNKLTCIGPGSIIDIVNVGDKKVTRFSFPLHIHPSGVGFALGEFKQAQPNKKDRNYPFGITFYSATENEGFNHIMDPVPEIMYDIYKMFFEQLPDGYTLLLSIVYIPCLQEALIFPGLIFFPSNYVLPVSNANVFVTSIPKLIECLLAQVIYHYIPFTTAEDRWIQHGLIGHFTEEILISYYRKGISLERRWNEINTLVKEDIHKSIVLSAIDPATGDCYRDDYLRIKAKALTNMLAISMNYGEASERFLILLRSMISDVVGSKEPMSMSNAFFKRIAPFCQSIKFSDFKRQWLKSNGLPLFEFTYTNDNRNRHVNFALYQRTSANTNIKFFSGQLIVQLRDLEQMHEYKFAVENQFLHQQLKYFSRKPKSKSKQFQFQALDNEQPEKIDIQIHEAVMWVSIDPYHQWPLKTATSMPLFAINNQLDLIRDVYSQHEALSFLENYSESDVLARYISVLKNDKFFYGVRGHAARLIASNPHYPEYLTLIEWYKEKFFNKKEDKPENHNFGNLTLHLLQLEVIKAISIYRNEHGYSPEAISAFLCLIYKETQNTDNLYSDESFKAECSLAIGRIRTDNINLLKQNFYLIENSINSIQTKGFCNIEEWSHYTALTSIVLKICERTHGWNSELAPYVNKHIQIMRNTILDNENFYLESKAKLFKCLLFLVQLGCFDITFANLVSDLKRLSEHNHTKEDAAFCFREIYRFVLNTPSSKSKDYLDSYLFCIPENKTRTDMINSLIKGECSLEISETLWSILTINSKNHCLLRSEALRAYSALYQMEPPAELERFSTQIGKSDLSVFLQRNSSAVRIERRGVVNENDEKIEIT